MSEKMTLTRKVSGRVFTVELPAEREEETGQLAVHIDVAQAGELAIAAALALEGPADGASFRFMRTTLGLRATELAGWLDVRAETLSRWETAERDVDRTAWLALGTLVLERLGRATDLQVRMQGLVDGVKPAKEARISL